MRITHEVEAELHQGKLPPAIKARHKRLAIERGGRGDHGETVQSAGFRLRAPHGISEVG